MKRLRRLVGVVGMFCASLLPAAHADSGGSPANVAVNGFARASAAYVPFSVNPNFDFWPVYSLSETDGSLSHGISAGFWPGFLVDATFFQFGYQPAERAFFGAAESAYPIGPVSDEAGSTDFARECAAGQVSSLPLPLGLGQAAAPEPLLTGCQSLYTQYRGHIPYSAASGSSLSDRLQSQGSANGAQVRAGAVTVGSAYTTSYTDASQSSKTDSGGTVILDDVQIGSSLRIKELISTVRAVSDGTRNGSSAQRSLTVIDASYLGAPVKIGNDGVTGSNGQAINDLLAAQGLQVRIVDGQSNKTDLESYASSGALVVHETRDASGSVGDAEKSCTQVSSVYPKPVATVSQSIAPNPVYSPVPPYDQLPSNVSVDEQIVPSIPCPLLLFQRSVDVGVALGVATASSRFQTLPTFAVSSEPGAPSSHGVAQPPVPEAHSSAKLPASGSLLPSFSNTPPVPAQSILRPYVFEGLGSAEAKGVKALFAGIACFVLALIGGRMTFRRLIRA